MSNNKEKKKVKIVNKERPSQGNFTTNSSVEYVRGGRTKADGSKEKGRSVTIGKDYQGDYRKTVSKSKKDGSVKTKSKKISDKRAERIKKRKDKTFTPINYGTMNNAINTQFKMNQGAHSDNDTPSGFRNPEGVAQAGGTAVNMGHPMNYGSPLPDKGHGTKPSKDDGHKHTGKEVYQMAMDKVKKQLETNRGKKQSRIKMGIGSGRSSGKNILS